MKNYEILKKTRLASNVVEYKIFAPYVAKHCMPGQFIILRVDEEGERIPLTICDYDRDEQSVSILVQEVGYSTKKLSTLNEGDALQDFVGPLGNPTDLNDYKNICLIGGGIGSAVIFPQAKKLFKEGKNVDVIIGARNKDLLMYVDEFKKNSTNMYISTDDGSFGKKGFVSDILKENVENGIQYDCVFVVGPMIMMKVLCDLTKELGIKTIVSMNSMMVDGTGMCGCCRVTVNGQTKYACIDGPEFDGHEIDFNEAISRSKIYKEKEHECNLRG